MVDAQYPSTLMFRFFSQVGNTSDGCNGLGFREIGCSDTAGHEIDFIAVGHSDYGLRFFGSGFFQDRDIRGASTNRHQIQLCHNLGAPFIVPIDHDYRFFLFNKVTCKSRPTSTCSKYYNAHLYNCGLKCHW